MIEYLNFYNVAFSIRPDFASKLYYLAANHLKISSNYYDLPLFGHKSIQYLSLSARK